MSTPQDPRPSAVADNDDAPGARSGFGHRMEKVLRAAQREAAEIVTNAEQDAAGALSRARLEAEAEEHDRRLRWAERERAVDEAVRAGAREVAAAQQRASEILEAAEQEAQRIRGHAHNRAQEINVAAEEAAAQSAQRARDEVERLERVRDAARADLDRLVRTLGGMRDALAYELEARPAPSNDPVPSPRTRGGAGLGNRPGDYRRTRAAGITSENPGHEGGPRRRPAHETLAGGA